MPTVLKSKLARKVQAPVAASGETRQVHQNLSPVAGQFSSGLSGLLKRSLSLSLLGVVGSERVSKVFLQVSFVDPSSLSHLSRQECGVLTRAEGAAPLLVFNRKEDKQSVIDRVVGLT